MAKRLMVLLAMLAAVLAVAVPAIAQSGTTAVTGVVTSAPGDGGPPVYSVTDEASGQRYLLFQGGHSGDFSAYEGKQVTVEGTPRTDQYTGFKILDVTGVQPADGSTTTPGPSPDRTATLSFELTVRGDPPAGTTFLGFIPAEGGISAPLTDPDGDGVFTGSVDIPKFPPGPAPPGTEPVSLPVQIVQRTSTGQSNVIKDFGSVKIDGDKTFSAEVSFDGDQGGATPPESTAPGSTTPGATAPESTTPESTTPGATTGKGTTGEQTRRDGRERTGGETTGGGATPETTDSNGGTGNAGGSSGANGGSTATNSGNAAGSNGGTQGGISGAVGNAVGNIGRGKLPDTGGGWTVLLLAGAVLIGGGWLLVRRATASRW